MTRDEAKAILALPQDKAVDAILALAEKAEKYDRLLGDVSPTTPSGMTPTYLKPPPARRRKRPGRNTGHEGVSRIQPEAVDHVKAHTLERCPRCHTPLKEPIKHYKRYIEDIPPVEKPEVTEHTVYGYWCPQCKKIVFAPVTDALPHAMIGLRFVVFTAWLHYLVGVSVTNIVRILSVVCRFQISAGGVTQAWKNLSLLLEPLYHDLGQRVATSAVLSADETGWRLNGVTHWLWCFTTNELCYYLITKSRGSPVIEYVLGTLFKGILICDFWGAYNKIKALAKQRCFYHLFTKLAKVDKTNASAEWKAFRKKLARLLKDAVRLSQRKDATQAAIFDRRKARVSHRLEQFLEETYHDNDAKRLMKRLKRHKGELFTFLEYEHVSPYNNHAEQQMRKPVLTRKICQQNRSEQGAETHAVFMSLFRSAELQGKNPVETVLALARASIGKEMAPGHELKLAA